MKNNSKNTTLDRYINDSGEESCTDPSPESEKETSESARCSTPNSSSNETKKTSETVSGDVNGPDNQESQIESSVVAECIDDISGTTVSESTAKSYASTLVIFINWLRGKDIESVDRSDIWGFLKARAANNKSKSTVQNDLCAIKKLYNWISLETELDTTINYLELDSLDVSKLRFPEPIEREPLDKDELELLYEHMSCFRDRLMTTVAAETGARNADVRKITLSRLNIDSENPQIELTNTKAGRTYTAYISEALATEIQFFIEHKRPAYPSHENSEYLFISREGEKLSSCSFTRIVRAAAEEAGIQEVIGTQTVRRDGENVEQNIHRVTPHTLRHTFNNFLEKEDVPAEYRAAALDQDSVETNRKHYSHQEIEYKQYVKRILRD